MSVFATSGTETSAPDRGSSGAGRGPGIAASAVNAWTRTQVGRWLSVVVTLVTFGLYLPPALSAVQIHWDGAEFVDIARRLVAGEGYTLGIKAFFYGGTEVIHDGLDQRAPLYTWIIAGLLRAGLGLSAVAVFNALVIAGCAGLVCAIGAVLFGKRAGVIAGLLTPVSPVVLVTMTPVMSDGLAAFLILLSAWLLLRRLEKPQPVDFAAAGATLGLSYLARPETPALAAALMLGVLLASRSKRAVVGPLAALVLGAALFVTPTILYSLTQRGSLSYSGQGYLYSVHRSEDIAEQPFGPPLLKPTDFIAANADYVARSIWRNLRSYAGLVLLDREWLLLLSPALVVAASALIRDHYPRAVWLLVVLIGVAFLMRVLTWSNFVPRYQLLTLLLLLPFAADGLVRLGRAVSRAPRYAGVVRFDVLAALLVAVLWSQPLIREYQGQFSPLATSELVPARSYGGITWAGPAYWSDDDDLVALMDWLRANSSSRDIVAHWDPYKFSFFAERPAVMLPFQLDAAAFPRYLEVYRPAYVVLNEPDFRPKAYEDVLLARAADGVTVTVIGKYHIFDVRALLA